MRETALKVMRLLGDLNPTLIGSVWRGTAREGSDIDVVIYGDPDEAERRLKEAHRVTDMTVKTFTVDGAPRTSTHLTVEAGGYQVEVVVRPPGDADAYRDERCDIYGDTKRGIGLAELERLMRSDPLRRFVPRRRKR
jgi:predicted nucleotidyltransferase